MKVLPGLIDKETVKKIIEMNKNIVEVNCYLLKVVGSPIILGSPKPAWREKLEEVKK